MVSQLRPSYGNKTFSGAELRYHRAHTYATVAAMDADVGTCVARMVYCIETARHYFGKPGAWIGLAAASSFGDTVADLSELPLVAADGDVRVVLNDGSTVPTLYIFDAGNAVWKRVADTRHLLSNGSVLLTGLLSVTDANVQVPTNPTHLVTKKYSDDQLDTHKNDAAAHAAAIATAVSSGTGSGIATHNVDPAAHSSAIAAAVAAGITTHDGTATAHAGPIAMAVDDGIIAHNTDPLAHSDTILGHVADHDEDPYAHTQLDESFPTSRSGRNSVGSQFVLDVKHGAPVTFSGSNADTARYTNAARARRPVGLAWRPSTIKVVASASLTFTNSTSKVTLSPAGLQVGHLVTFPSSTLNTGVFKITSLGVGEVTITPAPVDETVSTVANTYAKDGIVVFSGRFEIDRAATFATAVNIAEIVADRGDGKGTLKLVTAIDGKLVRQGDRLVVAGTVSCNGTYYLDHYNFTTDEFVIDTVFPASEVVGTVTIDHVAMAHGFGSAPNIPSAYYADVDDSDGYSTTAGTFLIGHQIDETTFSVAIERVDQKVLSNVTDNITLEAELFQIVPVAIVAASKTITLPPGGHGRVVVIKDVIGGAAANNFTIDGDGSETIDGATTLTVSTNYAHYILKWINNGWFVF